MYVLLVSAAFSLGSPYVVWVLFMFSLCLPGTLLVLHMSAGFSPCSRHVCWVLHVLLSLLGSLQVVVDVCEVTWKLNCRFVVEYKELVFVCEPNKVGSGPGCHPMTARRVSSKAPKLRVQEGSLC